MRIGLFESSATTGGTIDDHIAAAATAHEQGFASWWMPQIFGFESLSVLAIVGREVPGIELGTAVVPTYPRHPVTMAQLALTAQAASGGRLTLGIGLSHQIVIENMFGLSYAHPARHLAARRPRRPAMRTRCRRRSACPPASPHRRCWWRRSGRGCSNSPDV